MFKCQLLCPTLCDPIDCSPPSSSVHGISQARILEWVVMPSSRRPSRPRDQTRISCISCISRQIRYCWATGEASVYLTQFSSIQFSLPVMSHSLRPHELQHARPPCPSPTPGAHSNLCPLSRWCQLIISLSVVPFSSRPQSFPAAGSFQMNQFFASGGQSIGPLPDSPQ